MSSSSEQGSVRVSEKAGEELRRRLTLPNVPECIDDNSLTAFYFDDLGGAVWIAAVIDETCDATAVCSVNDGIFVNSEKIAATDSAL